MRRCQRPASECPVVHVNDNHAAANDMTTLAYAKPVKVLQSADKTNPTSNMEQLKRKKDAKRVVRTYHCRSGSSHPFQMDLA